MKAHSVGPTLGSTRTLPVLPPALSHLPASSVPFSASAQAWPVSLVRLGFTI